MAVLAQECDAAQMVASLGMSARRWVRPIGLVLLAPLVAGCLGIHEGSGGTPVSVVNASGRDVLVRRATSKWLIRTDETGQLEVPWRASVPLEYEILDAATCASTALATVDTRITWNSLVVLPPTGPPVIEAMDLKNRPPVVRTSPELCPGPKDGWLLWITNSTSETYILMEYQLAGAPRGNATIPAGASGLLSGNYGSFIGVGPGTFELRDSDCHVLQRKDHANFGTFVGSIESGTLMVQPGPLPSDGPNLWGSPWICPPTMTDR